MKGVMFLQVFKHSVYHFEGSDLNGCHDSNSLRYIYVYSHSCMHITSSGLANQYEAAPGSSGTACNMCHMSIIW
jgi:hypothetical protein